MKKNFYKPNKRIKRTKKIVEPAKAVEDFSLKKDSHSIDPEDIKSEVPVKNSSKSEKSRKTVTLREYEQSYLKISRSREKKKSIIKLPLHLIILFLIVFTILHRR